MVNRSVLSRLTRTSIRTLIIGLVLTCLVGVMPVTEVAASTGIHPDWVIQSTITQNDHSIVDAAFADSTNGCAVGSDGDMFVTHDGGQTWSVYASSTTDNLVRVRFLDAHHGYVVGGQTILRTSDGGRTWRKIVSSSIPSGIVDVAAPASGTLYVVSNETNSEGAYVSTDDGTTWQELTLPSVLYLSGIAFTSATEGWISYGDGLFHTTDAGQTWTQALSGRLYSGAFADSSNGYALGDTVVQRTTDGGATWTASPVPVPQNEYLHSSALTPGGQGIVATGSSIFGTQDGGATWHDQTIPLNSKTVNAVGFRGADLFAIVDGHFMHYGPLPNQPAPTSVPVPTGRPLPTSLPRPTSTAMLSKATALPSLHVTAITPHTVVVGSRVRLMLRGSGFDTVATVTIGRQDITDATFSGSNMLSFTLPHDLQPGTYDVAVTEPDGRTAILRHSLTVLPHLTLTAHALHSTVKQGDTEIILVQTLPGAQLSVRVTTSNGHALPHVGVKVQKGTHGQMRVLMAIGKGVTPGVENVTITAQVGQQQAKTTRTFRVVPSGAHRNATLRWS